MFRAFAVAAFSTIGFLTPAIAIAAQPAVPAFTTDPSKVETEARDQAWKRDLGKACGKIESQRNYSASDLLECQSLADQEPRCLSYKDFAAIYLQMKDGGAVATDVADGLAAMEKNTELYPPDFFNAVRRLYQIVFFTDREKLGTTDEFSARAYRACMSGRLL
jgi:hypothetical protein